MVAPRKAISALLLAGGLLLAAPVAAQLYSEGYQFLKAVEDKDGAAVTEMLETPGATVVNARDLSNGRSGLHIVADRRDLTWIGFLLQNGANPNVRDNRGRTPLVVATQRGFVDGVEALVEGGAQVDIADETGETPLISAVHARNTAMMRVLLEAGANPDRRDNSGRSARDYARLRSESGVEMQTIERYQRPEDERESANVYGPSF